MEYLKMGFDTELIRAYYDYMVDMAVFFGAEREQAKEQLKEALLLEINLANVSTYLKNSANL